MDDNTEKKQKEQKNCVTKRIFMFENYTDYLLSQNIILQSQQRS